MAKPQSGFIVIADITGYTSYLSHSELEHAQEVLQSLLELLIDHTKPPLVITRLAGDAVISYAIESRPVHGQAFIEMIEDTYVAFRRAINQMVLNTTCECNACANINALDLKFFVHHGTFSIQKLDAHEELVGHDVNTIFRMAKNEVTERTGIRAYTLYSDAAIQQLGLPGFSDGLIAHTQEYDDVGELAAWVQDMHPVWESKRESTRATIAPEDVLFVHESEFSVPPEIVWDYLSRPEFRSMIIRVDSQDVHHRQGDRVGTGTVFECFQGNRQAHDADGAGVAAVRPDRHPGHHPVPWNDGPFPDWADTHARRVDGRFPNNLEGEGSAGWPYSHEWVQVSSSETLRSGSRRAEGADPRGPRRRDDRDSGLDRRPPQRHRRGGRRRAHLERLTEPRPAGRDRFPVEIHGVQQDTFTPNRLPWRLDQDIERHRCDTFVDPGAARFGRRRRAGQTSDPCVRLGK